ncbi:Conserved hypothetical protein, putative phage-related [Herminiimonas arsenicoxydans]|uniref:Uncharacterized protein n=1 Tax=Herminiimonas arsenicoxydans TaxID=204773 RepID=A4G7F3_HERAR|nr:Conserved hypothetical protein, putative phage-related [Herminiimonas arsenicoxydans]
MTTELLEAPISAVAAYSPFYAQLAELEENNSKLVFNYADKKGNKEARSHINTLRLTKGALERVRKDEKAESIKIGKAIDAEAKEIEARIEAMIVVHQAEIDRIEQYETDRIAELETRLFDIGSTVIDGNSADIAAEIERVQAIVIDESWQEFATSAAMKKDSTLAGLRDQLALETKREAEAAELAKLRAESEARALKDREEAIRREAEQAAIARAAAQAAEEKAAADRAIQEERDKALREQETAARRELELKLAAENAERRRVEAEQNAERDRLNAIERAEADKQRAVKAEQDRVAAAAKAEADAQAKREANKAHLAKINRAAVAALVAGGITEDDAKLVITMIAKNQIPSVTINY